MDVRTCKMCGKLYNYIGSATPICPACAKVMEDKFSVVKKYIYDNPGASVQMVSEETEVPVKQIRIWVKEERLSFSDDSMIGVECEKCGAIIKTGRFCNACKGKLSDGLNSLIKKPEPIVKPKEKDSPRMRFLE